MKLRISNPFHARLATLALVLAAPHAHAATDLWTGATSGVWDTSVTNWSNGGTNQYTDGDIVQFGDTGGANLGITISSAVSPASVTFTDTGAGTNAYTFGTSSINGTGTTVTLDSGFGGSVQFGVANGYTGGTTLNGGTLTVGNATSLGTGTVTLNGGTFNNSANVTMTNAINVAGTTAVYAIAATTLTLSTSITGSGTLNTGGANSGSTLTISGNLSGFTGTITHDNVVGKGNTFFANLNTAAKFSTSGNTTSQEMRFQGTSKIGELSGTGGRVVIRSGTLTVDQSTNTTYAGNISQISGTGNLTKSGAGTLTLSGTNTYTGATTISDGTLALGASGSIANSSAIKVGTAGTFDVSAVSGGWSLGSGKSLGGDGAVTGPATFADASIFAWNLSVTDPGNTGSATVADTLAVSGNLVDGGSSGGSVFKILLAGTQTFADTFWTANHSWSNVLTSGNSFALQDLCTSFSYENGSGAIAAPTGGSFTLSGSTLIWTAGSGYSAWQSANSTAQTIDQDHDGDGVSNGVEFFIYGPVANSGFTALPGVTAGSPLSVTWTKAAGYTGTYGTHYLVETSATLASGSWTPEPDPGSTISFPSATEVKYTFPAGTKNFARLKVTGP